MKLLPRAAQQTGVRRVLHQHVLEAIDSIRRRAALEHQLGRDEAGESCLQFGLGKAGNRAEQGVRIMRRRRSQYRALCDLHRQVVRGGARTGVQFAAGAARSLRGLHRCAQSATDFRTGSLDFAFGGPDNRDIFPEGAISGTFWRFQAPNRGLIGPGGARLPAQPQTRAEEYAQQARIRSQPRRTSPASGSQRTRRWRKADSNHRSRSEKSGRSETRASASCIAQPTGVAANDIGADDRRAAGDQIIATRLRRRSCR
jgi:hypothetical protein